MQAFKSSKPNRGPIRRSLTAFCLLGPLVLMGCATAPQSPQILIPETFRAPCSGPATEGVFTVGDLAAFSVRQEGALQDCEAKRAGIVHLVDAAQVKPRPFWKFW